MMGWSFRSKLFAGTLVLVLLVELATMLTLDRSLRADLQRQLGQRLERQGKAAVQWLASGGRHPQRLAGRMADVVGARVTIFDPGGLVLGDSQPGAGLRLPPQDRAEAQWPPELRAARAGRIGRDVRTSTCWVALPAADGLIVRLSVPMSGIQATLHQLRLQLLAAGVVGLLAALVLASLLARVVARPLRRMTQAATQLTRGEYAIDLPTTSGDEFGTLAVAMRTLAQRLKEKIGELTAEREHLQRVQRVREEFVADASHELRTPVAAIQGFAETLLRAQPDVATSREFITVIHRHAERIGRLVEDLLRLSELDALVPPAHDDEPCALIDVFRHVAQTVRALAAARGVRLHVPETAPSVAAQAGAVEQMVENLVTNALRYGRQGGQVWLTAERQGDMVRVGVRDDGPGIASEHQLRIFDRFYRIDAGRSRDEGGTGLGLAIVKSLAESQRGRVQVQSEPGQGATFLLWLPAARV